MQLVKTLSLSRLHNSEYFELLNDFKMLLPGVLPVNPAVDEVMLPFNTAFEKLDVVMRVDRGSLFTQQIREADLTRGNTWKAMEMVVDAHLLSPVAREVQSALVIKRIFDVYGDFRKRSYDAESNDGRNLVQDLEKEENEPHCARVKINNWVGIYKTQIEEVKTLINRRDTEAGYKSSGDVKAVRVEMDPLFNAIVNLINAYVTIGMVSPEIENFVVLFNQKIKRYDDTLAAREGRRNGEGDSGALPEED